MKNNILSVKLWGEKVCSIKWDGSYQKGWGRVGAVVSFSRDFAARGLDISPLKLSLRDPYLLRGIAIPCHENEYEGLPAFLSDSLPDDWGNDVFRRWAQVNGIRQKDISPVDKLSFIGKRGMGAFEFEPEARNECAGDSIELASLYSLAEEIWRDRESASVNLQGDGASLEDLMRVGTSAGGQHPKAIIAVNKNTGEVRSGQLLLPSEWRQCIIKFNDFDLWPASEVEYAYYLMAKAAGVEMTSCELFRVGEKNHFLTERFDRGDGDKQVVSTLYALNGPTEDYSDIFYVARLLRLPQNEIIQLYRRMVFNFLAGNADDHDKNFSFLMARDGVWHLSPAYDLTFSVNLRDKFRGESHAMSLCGKRSGITETDLLDFARKNDISSPRDIINEVSEAVAKFADYAKEAAVPETTTNLIANVLTSLRVLE